MKATLTTKGQITIPAPIRDKLSLKPGDQIDFGEHATILVGRRVFGPAKRRVALNSWRAASKKALRGHPWQAASAAEVVDDLRGGKAVPAPAKRRAKS